MDGHHPTPAIRRWLGAERRGEEISAEAALAELFRAMPRPVAPLGFGDRVLARWAAEPVPWPLEQAALWLLLLCGAALTLVPRWLPGAWHWLAPAGLVATLVSAFVGLAHAVAALAPLAQALFRIGHWAVLAASAPPALVFVACCGLLAATAGRLLVGLLDQRSAGHAQAR